MLCHPIFFPWRLMFILIQDILDSDESSICLSSRKKIIDQIVTLSRNYFNSFIFIQLISIIKSSDNFLVVNNPREVPTSDFCCHKGERRRGLCDQLILSLTQITATKILCRANEKLKTSDSLKLT